MTFNEAFEKYILHQEITGWGFQQPTPVKLPNGFFAYPGGYFTVYKNGYRFIANGASLGETAIQEALILDPAGIPIARDTEDIR